MIFEIKGTVKARMEFEVEADCMEDAFSHLYKMTLEELIAAGYVEEYTLDDEHATLVSYADELPVREIC